MAINSYHTSHRRPATFRKVSNGRLVTYTPTNQAHGGLEIEVEAAGRMSATTLSDHVDALMGDLATCEHDGSLYDGFEIITAPATVEAILDYYKLDELCAMLDSNGAKSHNTETCGLHVHYSRAALGHTEQAKDMVCAKLLVLMDKFTDQLVKFARRDWTNGRWAPKYSNFNAEGETSTKKLLAKYKPCKDSGDRYHALNLTNEATIEFRIFRGTLNPLAIKATVELVDTMVQYCKGHTTPQIQTCTWLDLIATCNRPELREYCAKRGIVA
jgi:hypothetical protein